MLCGHRHHPPPRALRVSRDWSLASIKQQLSSPREPPCLSLPCGCDHSSCLIHAACLSVTGLFHVASRPQGSSTLERVPECPSSLKWVSHSVASDSLLPHGWKPTRLLCLWHSPGKSTGVAFQSWVIIHLVCTLHFLCLCIYLMDTRIFFSTASLISDPFWKCMCSSKVHIQGKVGSISISCSLCYRGINLINLQT